MPGARFNSTPVRLDRMPASMAGGAATTNRRATDWQGVYFVQNEVLSALVVRSQQILSILPFVSVKGRVSAVRMAPCRGAETAQDERGSAESAPRLMTAPRTSPVTVGVRYARELRFDLSGVL